MTTVADTAHGLANRLHWAPLFLHGVSPDGRICSCRKGASCPSKGKHPIEEGWAAKPFPSGADIQAMIESHPTANLGIRTGSISGIFVVDVDSKGIEPFRELSRANGGLPETFTVQTGSGFWHFYFTIPEGVTIGGSRGSLPAGVDVRGDGGQVVCPPSRTDKGTYVIYRNVAPALPPRWLVDLILTPAKGAAEVPEGAEKAPTAEGAEKTAAMVAKWTGALRALRDTPWVEGAGWDEACFRHAGDLVQLANSPWSPLTHEEARRLFMEAAPRDGAWDERAAKWDRAMVDKAGQMKDPPTPLITLDDMAGPSAPSAPAPVAQRTIQPPPPEDGRIAGADDELETDSLVIAQFCNESLVGNAHYNPKWGWHVWNGKIWAECELQVIEERFRLWVRSKVAQAARSGDTEKVKFYVKYLSGSRATAPVARCRGAMTIPGEVDPPFDKHPDLLTVGNGVVDLRTGALLPFSPHYMMTRMTSVPYIPGSRHPDWDTTLTVLPEDVIDWMQIRFGQAATGYPAWDDVVIFCHGSGSNGKTNLMAGVTKALGNHAAFLTEKVLSASDSDHTTDMTDLRGARLALLEETPEGYALNTKRLKAVAGTPVIKARKMRQDNVEWPATHALFVTTNHAPQVRAVEHGTWRRLALVDFPYRYVQSEEVAQPGDRIGDRGLRTRLEHSPNGQHEAALAWLVEGARRWYAMGALEAPSLLPDKVRKDTLEWRQGTDRISGWMEERIEPDPLACISSQEAYADFTAYLHSQGARDWAENTFADRLRQSEHARDLKLEKKRIIYRGAQSNLSRRGRYVNQDFEVGQKITVWTGMRFREDHDAQDSNVVDMAGRR